MKNTFSPAGSRGANNADSKKDNVKIYRPKNAVTPQNITNVIVDNYTAPDGRVYNRSEENILLAKKEVDDNKR